MTAGLESLKGASTILLTTYKRDGTPVPTPVSIAFDGDRAFFRSYDQAWKTKRLRHNTRVEIAPATLRGKPTGPAVAGRATLLTGAQAQFAARALAPPASPAAGGPGAVRAPDHALPDDALRTRTRALSPPHRR